MKVFVIAIHAMVWHIADMAILVEALSMFFLPLKSIKYSFLCNFATVHALLLPDRVPGNFDERRVLLPSDISKQFVYRKYKEACLESLDRCVCRRSFEGIWSDTLP